MAIWIGIQTRPWVAFNRVGTPKPEFAQGPLFSEPLRVLPPSQVTSPREIDLGIDPAWPLLPAS